MMLYDCSYCSVLNTLVARFRWILCRKSRNSVYPKKGWVQTFFDIFHCPKNYYLRLVSYVK